MMCLKHFSSLGLWQGSQGGSLSLCGEKEATPQTVLEDPEVLPFYPSPLGAGSEPLATPTPSQACPQTSPALPTHKCLWESPA